MSAKFVLTLRAPKEYSVIGFDTDQSIWSATDSSKTNVSRYTDDPERDSVMRIQGKVWTLGDGYQLGDGLCLNDSPIGKGQGAYRDFEVSPGIKYTFSCLCKAESGKLVICLYDQTNDVEIIAIEKDESIWRSYEASIEIPPECTDLRVYFLQDSSDNSSGPFYIDNVSLNGNALLYDPDSYMRTPQRLGAFHQTLGGRRVYDLRAIHYSLYLGWNFFKEDQYENLRQIYYSNEVLYFDDGNVPPLVERETVYETDEYNYTSVVNPSSTHKAYFDSSPALPANKTDFEATEFTTAEYESIADDDDNYKEIENPPSDYYIYNKFLILSSVSREDVRRLRVKVCASSNDSSPQNLDGCILYGWNGTNWVELDRTTNSAKNYLMYSANESEVASQFVDPDDNYIRLLLRSRNNRMDDFALSLRTYYAECEVNEGLDLTINLSHKAILDGNDDVIWVKNLTNGSTLVLNTDYTISNDRRSISISNQSSGDEIEVKYNHYFEVMFASLPEEWYKGGNSDDRARQVEVVLETLSESR